jgi:uncharacterized protein
LRSVYTFGRYLRGRFGKKVYKVPVSLAGFTCPNIDGTVAIGGCTFCENESFSPNLQKTKPLKKFALNSFSVHNPLLEHQLASLETQYAKTSAKLSKKFKAEAFIVYFQSFSNTYAPLDTLKALYEKALSFDGVVGLSIGTRSDCVSEELLDYLAFLVREKEIWVEFGIQSVFETTLERINRGHDFESVKKAVKMCKERGLKVCGHLIFGLPNEDESMMLESVHESVALGVDSFKFHPLYIVKNTALANDVKAGRFEPIGEDAFLSVLAKAIAMLPPKTSVQRVSAGIHDESLVAPDWCKNKHEQMSQARVKLLENGLVY